MKFGDLFNNLEAYNKGVEAYRQNDLNSVVKYMTEAIEANEHLDFMQAYKVRGFAFARLGKRNEAKKDLELVEEYIKDETSIYYFLGTIADKEKNYELAIKFLNRSIELKPDWQPPKINLSLALINAGKYLDALDIIEELISFNPTFDLYVKKGDVLRALSRDLEAYLAYQKASEINPHDFQSYQGLAFLSEKAGNLEDAKKYFSKCINIIPGLGEFYFNRARIKKKSNEIFGYVSDVKFASENYSKSAKQEIEDNLKLFTDEYYLFIDVETNGFPKNWNALPSDIDNWPRVIQISWQIFTASGKEIETKNYYIKPTDFDLKRDVIELTGLTQDFLSNKGVDIRTVLEELALHGRYCKKMIAHNISFDEAVISSEFIRNKIDNPLERLSKFCTMKNSTDICKISGPHGYKWPKLSELYETLFDEELEDAHNSLNDVRATSKCYWEII